VFSCGHPIEGRERGWSTATPGYLLPWFRQHPLRHPRAGWASRTRRSQPARQRVEALESERPPYEASRNHPWRSRSRGASTPFDTAQAFWCSAKGAEHRFYAAAHAGTDITPALSASLGPEVSHDNAERWHGKIRQDGLLGRTELLGALRVGYQRPHRTECFAPCAPVAAVTRRQRTRG